MKMIALVIVVLLAACGAQTNAGASQCPSGRVCVSVWQQNEGVSFQVTNNTHELVVLPEFTGLGSRMGAHLIDVISSKIDPSVPISSGGMPIGADPSDTVLRPQGWVGFTLPADSIRKVYRLSKGCQDVEVSYQINSQDKQYFKGAVQGMTAKVCL